MINDDLNLAEDMPDYEFWLSELTLLKQQLPRDLISRYLINKF